MRSRIVYLSWPAQEISGGIKLTYQHVEVLVASGHSALVATPDGEAPRWFDTGAETIELKHIRPSDVLVFPENSARLLQTFRGTPNRKVVFCQNHFMCYRGLDGMGCYSDFGVGHILAEGQVVVDYCKLRFPKLQICSVPVFIDEKVFALGTQKKLQIAYAPRKRTIEADFIRDLFRHQFPFAAEIPWKAISNCSENEVAGILRESAIYLSLCRFEALPLSILEAFASGCIVAGFTGIGGRTYTTAANGYWAAEDDCQECVVQLGKAVAAIMLGGDPLAEQIKCSLDTAAYYGRERFQDKILQFWNSFLAN